MYTAVQHTYNWTLYREEQTLVTAVYQPFRPVPGLCSTRAENRLYPGTPEFSKPNQRQIVNLPEMADVALYIVKLSMTRAFTTNKKFGRS